MTLIRQCSRPGCQRPAVATLEFNYADQVALIGPLQLAGNPHRWDLCEPHAQRTTVPKGWRLEITTEPPQDLEDADEEELWALAEAVQQASKQDEDREEEPPASRIVRREEMPIPSGRHPAKKNLPTRGPKRHLRAIPNE